ncbi:MAG: hypothetical protein PHS59_00615 [Paludibacter sp.]|nr:hypothetical protein [Paludibacter sp.]
MAESLETILESKYKIKTSRNLSIFWIGFTLYTAFFALSTTTTVNYIVCQFFQLIGMVLFIPTAIKLINWKFNNEYLKALFIIYCVWQLTVILRGISLDYSSIKVMIFDAESGIFRYFVPLILLFPKNPLYYKKIVYVILALGVLFLLYDVAFIDNLLNLDYENNNTKFTYEHFVKILSVPSGIILLTLVYQKKKVKYFAFLVIIVSVLFAGYRARRALIIMTLSPLLISYILYLYAEKKNFVIALVPFLLLFFALNFSGNQFGNKIPKIFSLLSDRGTEDTRSGVEILFYKDMNTVDWIVGKGYNGTYYCPDIDVGTKTDYRHMIETDYLYIILKGGIISLALVILIALPAFIKGFFFSKNILSKAAAIWIFLWLMELYPANVTTFSMHYILLWISIGICFSENLREASDEELMRIFSR